MLVLRRMVVPFRAMVAKVSRPEKTRSVNFGVVVVEFGGVGSSRRYSQDFSAIHWTESSLVLRKGSGILV
jgi:hypothetical protein